VDVRTSLLEAAITVFAESGVRGATTRRIAQEAGVNEVTLFRHFKSKDELIHAALELFVAGIELRPLPDVPVDPKVELLEWSRAHYRELVKHRSFIRKVMSEHEENPGHCSVGLRASAGIATELTSYFARLKKSGLTTGTWDERAATSMLMGALFSDAMGRDTMPERYPYSQREAVEWYVELLVRAIGAHAPARLRRKRG
jgi:AcrR family transcriptional regulator